MTLPIFTAGLGLGLSLIMAIGPQNVHVIRMGLLRQHVWLTVLTCILADVVLIGLGVWGLNHLGGLSPKLHGALLGAGILFLLTYGFKAAQRCVQSWQQQRHTTPHPPTPQTPMLVSHTNPQPTTRRAAVMAALAFSWLNPHAWLDTAVLIGSASLAFGANSAIFGMGAMTGSVIWFLGLGVLAFWLGQRLSNVWLWCALDGLVALMMWGSAAALIKSLLV